jgi:hypothetical protein
MHIRHPQTGATKTILYLDKTRVNQNHSLSETWQGCNDRGGLKVPIGKGGRVIFCHVKSSETGFLEGCKLVFGPGKNPQILITTAI